VRRFRDDRPAERIKGSRIDTSFLIIETTANRSENNENTAVRLCFTHNSRGASK
jgi:hypothetical protein